MMVGHNLLDGIQAAQLGTLGGLWHVLHQPAQMHPIPEVSVFALYSLIPWIGVMAAGYALGPVMLLEARAAAPPAGRARRSRDAGVHPAAGDNVYLDPAPWTPHDSIVATVLSFLNTEKYPPSTLYLAMTLGPALIALAALNSARGKFASFFVLFGRVPLFYYVAHLLLLHALAVVFAAVSLGAVAWMFGAPQIGGRPEGYGLALPGVYLMWIIAVALLYVPCRWYAGVKRQRGSGWLSYA